MAQNGAKKLWLWVSNCFPDMSPPTLQANRLEGPLTGLWVSRAGKDGGWRRGRLSDVHQGKKE